MKKTYVIGDVQGCLAPLKALLQAIDYSPAHDTLWFAGDLVNRGPHSLETLRFIHALPNTLCVLGNHDLALLAARHHCPAQPSPAFLEILEAPDSTLLLDWLQSCPILHHDTAQGFTLTHAGIFPAWDLPKAIALAQELEGVLRGSQPLDFFQNMYGNEPTCWHDTLDGWDRLRFITNAFTRMRFCTQAGELNLDTKGAPEQHPELIPWFLMPNLRTQQDKLLFGHWAALGTQAAHAIDNIYPLDSGCVWGNCLTAFCLQTQKRITVDCDF